MRRGYTGGLQSQRRSRLRIAKFSFSTTTMFLWFRNFRMLDQIEEARLRKFRHAVFLIMLTKRMLRHAEYSIVHSSDGSRSQRHGTRGCSTARKTTRHLDVHDVCILLMEYRERAFSNNVPFQPSFGHSSAFNLDSWLPCGSTLLGDMFLGIPSSATFNWSIGQRSVAVPQLRYAILSQYTLVERCGQSM
jgi:hypothetical protein